MRVTHMNVTPFTRRCICPSPPASVSEHTQACNDNYRTEFMDAKDAFKRALFSRGHTH